MLEPRRSQYLQAMGIDIYVPRAVLPGAAPSAACAWDESLFAEPEPEPEPAAPEPAPVAAILERAIPAEAPRRAPAAPPEPEPRRERPAAGAVPRFALGVVTCDRGLLIVDEAPGAGAARADYLRLLGNVLFAIGRGGAQLGLDVFLWPMARHPQLDQGADAARETCAAYLNKQIQGRAVDTLLLLGDTAATWVPETVQRQVRCIRSISAWACLDGADAKRRLWRDLQPLAAAPR